MAAPHCASIQNRRAICQNVCLPACGFSLSCRIAPRRGSGVHRARPIDFLITSIYSALQMRLNWLVPWHFRFWPWLLTPSENWRGKLPYWLRRGRWPTPPCYAVHTPLLSAKLKFGSLPNPWSPTTGICIPTLHTCWRLATAVARSPSLSGLLSFFFLSSPRLSCTEYANASLPPAKLESGSSSLRSIPSFAATNAQCPFIVNQATRSTTDYAARIGPRPWSPNHHQLLRTRSSIQKVGGQDPPCRLTHVGDVKTLCETGTPARPSSPPDPPLRIYFVLPGPCAHVRSRSLAADPIHWATANLTRMHACSRVDMTACT